MMMMMTLIMVEWRPFESAFGAVLLSPRAPGGGAKHEISAHVKHPEVVSIIPYTLALILIAQV